MHETKQSGLKDQSVLFLKSDFLILFYYSPKAPAALRNTTGLSKPS
ncbi:MAG: hypothetical protein ACI8QG_000221 [Flavobacteriales bacterium]|jgi:hypothetical protein